MSGLVGIVANDFARVSVFSMCVTNMQQSLLENGIDAKVQWLIGGDWVGARNQLSGITLNEDFEWLWFMDDDHVFSPNALQKLLAHDVPLVVPVCLKRFPPYTPVTYVERIEGVGPARYLPLYLPDSPEEGLIEIVAGGSAGMLIKREVLEAVPPPWFELTPLSEDLVFCEKAVEAGFSIYCDLSVRIGHVTTATVMPVTDQNGEWMMGVTVGLGTQITVPFDLMEEDLT